MEMHILKHSIGVYRVLFFKYRQEFGKDILARGCFNHVSVNYMGPSCSLVRIDVVSLPYHYWWQTVDQSGRTVSFLTNKMGKQTRRITSFSQDFPRYIIKYSVQKTHLSRLWIYKCFSRITVSSEWNMHAQAKCTYQQPWLRHPSPCHLVW